MKNYQDAVAYIHSRPRLKKETTQRRILNLLNKLDNPQRQVTAIHVVGTNGKGSVVAYLMNLLMGIKQKVGTFTSPFMIRFNERISIDGKPISDKDLLALVNFVKPVIEEIDKSDSELAPSEFEVITALMYLYFVQQKVDLAIVEAGIGGENDSTNVDDRSIMTIITTIGMDHMKLLGNTIQKIARTKAGIIKTGTPTVVGQVSNEALDEIKAIATKKISELVIANQDFSVKANGEQMFNYQSADLTINQIKIEMLGQFEIEDAGVAIAAFINLNKNSFNLNNGQITTNVKRQIQKTTWIGRMESIGQNPLTIIDGAHNVPAIQKLKESLEEYSKYQIDLVMAVFADKQYQQMLSILESMPNVNLYLTSFVPDENRKVADFSFADESRVKYYPQWEKIISELEKKDANIAHRMVVITGSLLFISEVRKIFIKKIKEKLNFSLLN
ncbi:bifunctional folylpolyglutamate synthase/dihydrofolate synthase [Fructilactobacillus sanfranciscensis]|uniref:bifunctional folylpolyglutamate synthase/dihydrofolate synthase n=1 Tax=Fructilactobacillus sanfranciscensis TaxID=1625 RepID=UPI0015E1A57F|nr:folylpolyglutamate synthase/dihydrofolate synthase family protein [Fructilactobacillus sanfranciscensis]